MPVRTLAILVGLVATILVGWVFHVGAGILQPLVIAAFLCSMLQPVVRWLAKRYVPPAVTVIVLVTLLFLGIARVGAWAQEEVLRFVGVAPSTPSSVGPVMLGPNAAPRSVELGADPAALQDLVDSASVELPETVDGELSSGADERDDVPPTVLEQERPENGPEAETSPPNLASAESTDPDVEEAGANPDGEETADQAEEEPRPLGWSGIVANLAARLRESNLPRPLSDFLVSAMYGIDAKTFATTFATNTLGFFTGLLLVVIYMLFIFAEQAIFRSKILSVAGDRANDAATALSSIARGVQRYLSVKTVISLATGILCYSVLQGLKIPYAHFFGFLTFLLNYIPTFGSLAAGGLATITTFASKGSWESALIVAITFLAVNLTLGSYIEPRILGRELNLSPLVIVISVVVWAGLWGIAGTFLAVPLMATIQIVLANNEATRPIAILLSSGPPREERLATVKKKKARKKVSYPGS